MPRGTGTALHYAIAVNVFLSPLNIGSTFNGSVPLPRARDPNKSKRLFATTLSGLYDATYPGLHKGMILRFLFR